MRLNYIEYRREWDEHCWGQNWVTRTLCCVSVICFNIGTDQHLDSVIASNCYTWIHESGFARKHLLCHQCKPIIYTELLCIVTSSLALWNFLPLALETWIWTVLSQQSWYHASSSCILLGRASFKHNMRNNTLTMSTELVNLLPKAFCRETSCLTSNHLC